MAEASQALRWGKELDAWLDQRMQPVTLWGVGEEAANTSEGTLFFECLAV